jgi:hypothetical protein
VSFQNIKRYSTDLRNAGTLRLVFAALIFLVAALSVQAQLVVTDQEKRGIVKPMDPLNQSSQSETAFPESVVTGNGIDYHGGPVMQGSHNIYLLWYGNWSNDTAIQILPEFISGLNGSPYFNTNSTYGDNSGNIADTVTLMGQYFDTGSQGANLGTTGVAAALSNALQNSKLPVDGNGIYLVLTSPDVTEGNFCGAQDPTTAYCGYHTHETFNTTDIKFGFVGDSATQCPSNGVICSAQSVTPNGNEGADAMASVMAHEINETVTDPDINGWYLSVPNGGEVGDLCNFRFGPRFVNADGSQFNVILGGKQFLIQKNWLNASGGLCSMSWEGGKARIVGADFDADVKADYAVWRPSTGTWYAIRSNNSTQLIQQWGDQASGDISVPGDYDGDGKADIAVWRASTGTWYVIRSSDGAVVTQQWGVQGDIPVPGDYDGDGKTDFAVWRPSTGTWFVIRSGDGIKFNLQWGVQSDIPVPGDYDGDGRTDFAVWRPSTGTWFVVHSSDFSITQQQWGSQPDGDIPVPGDYDGDGKTDFAVWRPHNGTWFVLRSSDGGIVQQQWGDQASGDRPVPGDYDGDGKTDFAVWRASTGTWFVLRSSDNGQSTRQWGLSTDIPLNKPVGQ